jgi:Asp-tRNA(Asn)/Glu-tRNA(Gln) amidotransferase C subunit
LAQVSETQFDRTVNAVQVLRRTLDNPGQSVAERVQASGSKAKDAETQLQTLITQINSILAAMEGLSKLNELIAELARIEKQEEDLEIQTARLLKRRIEEELRGLEK